MAHASPDTHASSDVHEHPSLPPVHDEAADTPTWVPVLGLALLLIFAVLGLLRAASREAAEGEAIAPEAPAAEAPAAEAPAAE